MGELHFQPSIQLTGLHRGQRARYILFMHNRFITLIIDDYSFLMLSSTIW